MTGVCEEQCFLNGQGCKGHGQYQADAQCCSGHCDVLSVDGDGVYFGHCAAKLADKDDDESAPAPAANPADQVVNPISALSCTVNTQACYGYSQDWANDHCCSGYCHVMDVDRETGFMTGVCEEQCFLNGQDCRGSSYYEADAECCSGYCNVYSEDASGEKYGKCQRKRTGKVSGESAPAPATNPLDSVADPVTAPVQRQCKSNNKYCSGYTQDQGNDRCCSGYCHLMDVNEQTGFMTGLCKEQCYLVGQSCSGNSAYQANADCCSGICDIKSIDADGGRHGVCIKKPTPAPAPQKCKAVGRSCAGATLSAADSKCCSGNCNHLTYVDGIFYGTCERACQPIRAGCSGYSHSEANSMCCSGRCGIISTAEDGHMWGRCLLNNDWPAAAKANSDTVSLANKAPK